MNEHTKIGDYTFSEKCAGCPWVRLAVERSLAKLAMFPDSLEVADFDTFRQHLRMEIVEEIIATDVSFGGGSFADDCSGANLVFNETGNCYEAECGREIIPFQGD